jgi:hypothetical protein
MALGLVLLPTLGVAQEGPRQQEPRPVLGGHRLIWNPFTQSPYPRTAVRSLTGGGIFMNAEFVPSFEIGDQTVEAVRGDLLFAELEFEYMHQVQPWLGVWARLGGLARLGTDAGGLLAQGVTAITGYELGWLFKVYESESFVLSGTAALSNDGVTNVDILRWVRGIVEEESDSSLTASGPQLRGRGGVRGAWGIDETWGLQFQSELGYGQVGLDDPEGRVFWDNGASLSLDLYPGTDVPLGFVLSAATRGFPREGGNPEVRTIDFGLRTAYTGRDNFLIALDTNWNGFELADGDDVGLLRIGLSLQLFF